MDLFANLALGFSIAFTPFNLTLAAAVVVLGTLIGALPGVGPVSGIALLLPLTFGMPPTSGIIMLAALGSFVAGTVGVVLLMGMSPLLARWALSFGPPETFALMLLGLTTVTGLTGDNAIKGYISMVLGLMLSMVGFDLISGNARYTGGINEMLDGVDFLPVAIGLFGLGEVLAGAERAARLEILNARYGLR